MTKQAIYIGKEEDGEEFYIKLEDKGLDGWSFMGLRPETEETLRERAREQEPEDFFDIPSWATTYFNYEKWADDMEEEWYNHHDVQLEDERGGKTYYLGFGTGTDIFNYFKEHKIKSYSSFKGVFGGGVGLSEIQFKQLLVLMRDYKKDMVSGYKKFLEWSKGIYEFPKQE